MVWDMRRDPSRRRIFLALVGALLLSQACASASGAQGRDLTVAEGATFTVVFDGRAGAGYAWSVDGVDVDTVALVGRSVEREGSGPGVPERQTFVFLAKRSGTVTLNFTYARPWVESAPPPAQTYRVQVTRC
jgi:predicted secreted protein